MLKFLNGQACGTCESEDQEVYDEFKGKVIIVDVAEIDGQTEAFEGSAWLDGKCRSKEPIGWDFEWQPDRTKDSDNPIALMQFADESTALLLRTHRACPWLPISVMRVLMSQSCAKVGAGWEGPDKQKMQSTFNFQPVGIQDLSDIAKKKGLKEQGLKALTERFGLKIRKDSRVARTNWVAPELTQQQISYAAEDAHFAFLLYEKIMSLPDKEQAQEEGFENVNQGVLKMEEGWEEQGIRRRSDGLFCALCDQGPMNVPMVVMRHLEGKKHVKKLATLRGETTQATNTEVLTEELIQQGIVAGDGVNKIPLGQFKCTRCDAGPFTSVALIDAHLKSKKHQKAMNPAPEPVVAEKEVKDPFSHGLWNLPDYVSVEGKELVCTLCASKAPALLQMCMHLGGDKHARKCRSMGHDEILFVKERGRIEVMRTGKALVRTGFTAPKGAKGPVPVPGAEGKDQEEEEAAGPGALAAAQDVPPTQLPEGWEEFRDANSGNVYYHNRTTQVTQWDRPEAPAAPSPVAPVRVPEAIPEEMLPPGWEAVWCDASGKYYYADVETQAAQWKPPEPHVQRPWTRTIDQEGRAYWGCGDLPSFYESDPHWKRLVDPKGRIYWSNESQGLRFFET
mmetsp:Transcript_117723/g.262974  ORF Transcript_117723/g.262974 Transcript_117723/m.262974 type:complete len:621 (-) Transcript_117723:95-1957(-)